MVSSVSENGSPAKNSARTAQSHREDVEIALQIEKRQIVAEVVLHVRAHQRRREHRRDEQQQMQPEPRSSEAR